MSEGIKYRGGLFQQSDFQCPDLLGCSNQAQRRMFFKMGKIRDGGDNEKLYQILEVNKNAAEDEIKKNFFRLAKQYHPDVNKTKAAKQKYLDINEAYQTLSDPEKRGVYDAYGMTANEQDNTEEQFGDFGNIFKNMFKGAAAEAQEE